MKTLRPPGVDTPASRDDPMGLVGHTLDGQFRIEAVVGAGGFSVVYRGLHLGLSEPVAIKCLRLQGTLGSAVVESFLRRFRDEGRILYRLSQGNLHIVRSIASGTTIAPGTSALVPYIVLEWLEGRSLAQDLDARRAAGYTGRTLDGAIALLDTAAAAIAYAHEAGVVHRDLNPGNIFLAETREGTRAKVLDFGIAKVVSDHVLELGPRAPTMGQLRVFSPAYAAPEQLDDRIGKIAPWTDVYTLAMVLLEVLRDDPALRGESLAALYDETLDRTKRPSPRALGLTLPPEVEEVFDRALALDPKERFIDVGEFWSTLKGMLRRSRTSLAPPSDELAPDTVRMDLPPGATPVPPAPAPSFDRTLPLHPSLAGPAPLSPASAAGPVAPPPLLGASPPSHLAQGLRFEAAPPVQAPPAAPPPPALFGPPSEERPAAPSWDPESIPRALLPTVPPMDRPDAARLPRWLYIVLAILIGAAIAGGGLALLAHWLSPTPLPAPHGQFAAPKDRLPS